METSEPTSNHERTELEEGRRKNINGEPQRAHPEGSQKKWVWTEGLAILQRLGLGELEARNLIGRWLSKKTEPIATEEMLRRAILAAEAAGTGDPIPFITAILQKEASGGVRRDGDEWIVPHGTEEYAAHRKRALIDNGPEVYRWPDTPGHEARAKFRWPRYANNDAEKAEIVTFRQGGIRA